MIITHKLEMDLAARGAMPRIDVVQGDTNTRALELTLLSAGESWPVPEGTGVWLRYCKSDGTKGVYDTLPDGSGAWKVEENRVSVTLAPQMMTAAGTVLAQVELVQGAFTLATFTVRIVVERNPAADAVGSEDYFNMLQWMEGELDRRLAEAKDSGEFDGKDANIFLYAQEAGFAGTETDFRQQLVTPCLPLAGGSMAGAVNMGGHSLTGLAAPQAQTDAVTKEYVDQKSIVKRIVLEHSRWNNVAPHQMDVEIPELRSSDWIQLALIYPQNSGERLAAISSFDYISYWELQDGVMHVVCLDKKPMVTMNLFCQILHLE